ncbi:MAG TPA: SDR family NAD(P)-dependent oxidoreductase, partial [Aquificaceae bacterium]|nr:SDR family NAD(P)-dependent oxidoreductase [Aquificaceae bacterium]
MKLFITGIGSGLGKALAEEALKRGYEVYAISRHLPEELKGKVKFVPADLSQIERIYMHISKLLQGVKKLSLVILNAGILGKMKDMKDAKHRKMLYQKMVEYMKNDRAQHTILTLSKFGLMQITRQRTRPLRQPTAFHSFVQPRRMRSGTVGRWRFFAA